MRHPLTAQHRRIGLLLSGALAIVLLAAACGGGSSNSTSATKSAKKPTSIRITSPADGAQVPRQFTVKLDPSVPIGEPSSGLNHVHLYYDGNRSTNPADYDIAYKDTFKVTRLSPGEHTIEAVIANADHSTTNVQTEIHVMVTSAAGNSSTTTGGSGGGNY